MVTSTSFRFSVGAKRIGVFFISMESDISAISAFLVYQIYENPKYEACMNVER